MKQFLQNIKNKSALTLALGVMLSACSGDDGDIIVSSTNIPTSEIYATIDIYSDGSDRAYASVQLTKESPPAEGRSGDEYVRLDNGNQLWITTGDIIDDIELDGDLFSDLVNLSKAQELFEGEERGFTIYPFFFFWSFLHATQIHYNGDLSNTAEGSTYTVSLFRGDFIDAKNSHVQMPSSFIISAPLPIDTFSRADDNIQVVWQPSEPGVTIEASIDTSCAGGKTGNYATDIGSDDGVIEIPAGMLQEAQLTGTCNTSLTLAKRIVGRLDSNFTGGFISANQVRTVSFLTTD
ncbi:hypothetical protein [Teredinibacter haidensis]|uniref:hypothetical protein n=1 Tax=Teredinibacter haidensis TaxID=2731755 RepID=UPI000A855FD9|nr:hypothetical protein [Teredinibacter haidensis]